MSEIKDTTPTLFLVVSHFQNGPSIWPHTNYEEAKSHALELLEDDYLNNIGEDALPEGQEDSHEFEMRDCLNRKDFFGAAEAWENFQRDDETNEFVEAIIIMDGTPNTTIEMFPLRAEPYYAAWSAYENDIATKQGWSLFALEGDQSKLQIQRIDDPLDGSEPIFDGDDAAVEFITQQAKAGINIARRAMYLSGLAWD